MRVLVYEYVSGGGMAGRACPPALAREGAAMRDALVADLARVPGISVLASADPRFPLVPPPGVTVAAARTLRSLLGACDAVWLVAPESGGRLARLAAAVERAGKTLLGPSAAAIRLAADKALLMRRLARTGLPVPATRVLRARVPAGTFPSPRSSAIQFPVVVKPVQGAGCQGVAPARDPAGLRRALARAGALDAHGRVLVQQYVDGIAASVALLADGRRALPLAVNRQQLQTHGPFEYGGGETPLDHPLARRAAEVAGAACEAVPGLRGYVGVDVVLAAGDVVIIEINARLTTSYLGVRRAFDANVAALALQAARGELSSPPPATRRVRFLADGTITGEEALP